MGAETMSKFSGSLIATDPNGVELGRWETHGNFVDRPEGELSELKGPASAPVEAEGFVARAATGGCGLYLVDVCVDNDVIRRVQIFPVGGHIPPGADARNFLFTFRTHA